MRDSILRAICDVIEQSDTIWQRPCVDKVKFRETTLAEVWSWFTFVPQNEWVHPQPDFIDKTMLHEQERYCAKPILQDVFTRLVLQPGNFGDNVTTDNARVVPCGILQR